MPAQRPAYSAQPSIDKTPRFSHSLAALRCSWQVPPAPRACIRTPFCKPHKPAPACPPASLWRHPGPRSSHPQRGIVIARACNEAPQHRARPRRVQSTCSSLLAVNMLVDGASARARA